MHKKNDHLFLLRFFIKSVLSTTLSASAHPPCRNKHAQTNHLPFPTTAPEAINLVKKTLRSIFKKKDKKKEDEAAPAAPAAETPAKTEEPKPTETTPAPAAAPATAPAATDAAAPAPAAAPEAAKPAEPVPAAAEPVKAEPATEGTLRSSVSFTYQRTRD